MAPTIAAVADVAARYIRCPSGYYYSDGYCYYRSRWNRWGRWVLVAIIIVVFLALLVLMALRARSRRGAGRPMYGTGWMGRPQQQQQQQAPAPQYAYGPSYAQAPPPPEYSQQAQQPYKPFEGQHTGTTYNSNQGYYGTSGAGGGGQGANDIPLQQPGQAYYPTRSGAADDYAPPEGPPPSKR